MDSIYNDPKFQEWVRSRLTEAELAEYNKRCAEHYEAIRSERFFAKGGEFDKIVEEYDGEFP